MSLITKFGYKYKNCKRYVVVVNIKNNLACSVVPLYSLCPGPKILSHFLIPYKSGTALLT